MALCIVFPQFGLFVLIIVVFIYDSTYIWITLVIVLISFIIPNKYKPEPKPKKMVWRGKMQCNDCRYIWKSRRDNPPAKCANCKSNNISIIKEL